MCSCYVASRNSDSKEEESRRIRGNNAPDNRKQYSISSENIEDGGGFNIMVNKKRNKSIDSNGLQVEPSSTAPLKSNLKTSASMVEMSSPKMNQGMKKVSWSDAHGKDIAHVQEFEPSEEGELGGVGNSCKCAIQ